MARPLQIEQAGGWYHFTVRGNERRAIFRSDRDREHFLELLEEMTRRFGVRLHASRVCVSQAEGVGVMNSAC